MSKIEVSDEVAKKVFLTYLEAPLADTLMKWKAVARRAVELLPPAPQVVGIKREVTKEALDAAEKAAQKAYNTGAFYTSKQRIQAAHNAALAHPSMRVAVDRGAGAKELYGANCQARGITTFNWDRLGCDIQAAYRAQFDAACAFIGANPVDLDAVKTEAFAQGAASVKPCTTAERKLIETSLTGHVGGKQKNVDYCAGSNYWQPHYAACEAVLAERKPDERALAEEEVKRAGMEQCDAYEALHAAIGGEEAPTRARAYADACDALIAARKKLEGLGA